METRAIAQRAADHIDSMSADLAAANSARDNLRTQNKALRAALFEVGGYLNGALMLAGHADTTEARAALNRALCVLNAHLDHEATE